MTSEEQDGLILVKQANQLISILNVEVSSDASWTGHSAIFRLVADAYESLMSAEKKADRVAWERTKVDGRDGAELMKRLWAVREKIRLEEIAQKQATT